MRVITGQARGMRLTAPNGLEVRPTSEMAKEALFSILQNETPGSRVLDLFSGSGQLGIEALSRGALSCVFVDNNRDAQRVIKENLEKTKLIDQATLVFLEAGSYLSATKERFDIALLDPPYHKGLLEKVLPLVAETMNSGGVILCETDRKEVLPSCAGSFVRVKEYRYGKSRITAYRKREEESAQ